MKLPLSLLNRLIPVEHSLDEVAETLTLLGIEVDAIYGKTAPFSGVVVAEVKAVSPHPNAKKLRLAEVFDGKETIQIVCGAPNCRAGIRTAFAKKGAQLTDPSGKSFFIKEAVIQGISSHGMLCSAAELSLYEEEDGILELPVEFSPGEDCLPLLWDPVFELSLTPNLGHCMSALGIARELSAAWQIPLRSEKQGSSTSFTASSKMPVSVHVEDPSLCLRYMAKVLQEVQIAPSPFWLQKILKSAGLRPINNVVDVTNYMLLKTGKPMHAFDLDKIEGKKIRVAPSTESHLFQGLDGKTWEVPPGALFIHDAEKPIALAGILGGSESAVSASTRNLLLEVASFSPSCIHKYAKKIGLRTDSSLRFEKGVDPSSLEVFLQEAVSLLQEIAQAKPSKEIIDCKAQEFAPRLLSCRPTKVNQLLGTKLSENEILSIFTRLGFEAKKVSPKALQVLVPLYRTDILEEIDLIEEVARIYGYNHIERVSPRVSVSTTGHDPAYLFETKLRQLLVGFGLQEWLTCDLISPKSAKIAQELSLSHIHFLQTLHSKSEEYSILRPSLLPGILQVIRTNLDQKNGPLRSFELGRIHFLEEKKPTEIPMLALVLGGKQMFPHWSRIEEKGDFFDLKGLIENLLKALHLTAFRFVPSQHLTYHPNRQADLWIEQQHIGCFGQLHPELLKKAGIEEPIYYAELSGELLAKNKRGEAKLTPLSQFPSSERDWTLSISSQLHISTLFQAIEAARSPLLEHFALIDLYPAEENKNVTFRFVYRDKTKTVLFQEVETTHAKLIEEVLAKTQPSR